MPVREIEIACLGYGVKADVYEGDELNVTLILIGFMSEKAKYAKFAKKIVAESSNSVVVLDYSGHGVSPYKIEDVMPAENFVEVIKTFDWIKNTYPKSSISVIGTSYGGFLATQLTKYRTFDTLVLRVPALFKPEKFYTEWKNMNEEETYEYMAQAENLVEHPLLKRASSFEGRVAVVIHEKDSACPLNTTQAFVDAFQAESWVAPGLQHSMSASALAASEEDSYYQKIIDWMSK